MRQHRTVEHREEQSDSKYADEDGCKAKPGVFVSVAKWKEEHRDEYMPGVTKEKKEAPPAVEPAVAPVPNNSPSTAGYDDDDIPF